MSFLPSNKSFGFLYAHDQFEKINNVQTDSFFYGGSSETTNVNTDVPDTLDFLFGSIWELGKSERNYRLGINFSSPLDKVTEPATNDPYQPQYSGYNADSQRLTLSAGLSGVVTPQLSFGLGVSYYLVQAATYQSRMPTDTGTGRTSTGNFKMRVNASLAPMAGLTWSDRSNWMTLYFAGTRDHKLRLKNETLFGPVGSTVSFDTEASLFYDPETWSLGYAFTGDEWDFLLSGDWERWNRYDGGYVRYTFRTFNGSLKQYPVDMTFNDIFAVKAGVSRKWGESALRLGLGYRPSPHKDLDAQTNYIEPDRWVAGIGYAFKSMLWNLLDESVKFETHFQTHYLVPKDVTKTDSTSIGAPGYKVGGYVFSCGLNMVMGL